VIYAVIAQSGIGGEGLVDGKIEDFEGEIGSCGVSA
jgi:hypothetical protein